MPNRILRISEFYGTARNGIKKGCLKVQRTNAKTNLETTSLIDQYSVNYFCTMNLKLATPSSMDSCTPYIPSASEETGSSMLLTVLLGAEE